MVKGPLRGPLVHTILGVVLAGAAYGFYLFSPLGKNSIFLYKDRKWINKNIYRRKI
jgi:hypothetical protein